MATIFLVYAYLKSEISEHNIQKADVSHADKFGATALQYALTNKNGDVAALLREGSPQRSLYLHVRMHERATE